MDIKRTYLIPSALFAAGLLALITLDYSIRHFTGTLYGLGLPETIWFFFQIVVALASLTLSFRNARSMSIRNKLLLGSALIISGLVVYFFIIYGYVIGTRIDGF